MQNIIQSSKDNWEAKGKIFELTIKYDGKKWMLTIRLFKVLNINIDLTEFVESLKRK